MNETKATVEVSRPDAAPAGRGDLVRPALWVLLVISLIGNAVASFVYAPLGVALGVVAAGCVAGLVMHHRARRLR